MNKYLLIASMIASFAATATWGDISKWSDYNALNKTSKMYADARTPPVPEMRADSPRYPNSNQASAPSRRISPPDAAPNGSSNETPDTAP
ncbi:hypothetical protein C1H71_00880 [Iodobacter fluviatilis]|uniref:DUF4124 domain-containing protein n=1 Tax=Iodobacter fluviatilis TaxID=537 RepID=A0A7G3G548_9NEIS|nr:hypothetical protein C1H71_00880 [Iodobacter fluviatilis]